MIHLLLLLIKNIGIEITTKSSFHSSEVLAKQKKDARQIHARRLLQSYILQNTCDQCLSQTFEAIKNIAKSLLLIGNYVDFMEFLAAIRNCEQALEKN